MGKLKLLLSAAALCAGLLVTSASAMPVAPLPNDTAANFDQVRMVCNAWGRCWWRPNYYYGGYGGYGYGPRRFYGGGYGYRGWGHRGYGRRW